MAEDDAIDERLRAVERALTDEDRDLTALEDAAGLTARLEAVEDRLEAVEDQLADLDAATQAVRGYVGNVRTVNRDVERRADAALAAAEDVRERLATLEDDTDDERPRRERPNHPEGASPSHEAGRDRRDGHPDRRDSHRERREGANAGFDTSRRRADDDGSGAPPGSRDQKREAGADRRPEDAVAERVTRQAGEPAGEATASRAGRRAADGGRESAADDRGLLGALRDSL
ncbi:MAG: hypothetical protein ABEJ31_07965 [Haloarculaceae archaeon]